ncbi:MAG: AsmA-like C-terminal domain-containing protein [Candidatus Omnitrophota bacterium]
MISILTTIGLILFIVGAIYLGKFVLPAQTREYVSNLIIQKTGYGVTVEGITYLPLTQYYLKNIVLYEKDDPETPIVTIEGLSFNFKIWPFLKGRRVVASLGLSNLRYGDLRFNGFTSMYLKDLRSKARRPFLENMDGMIVLKGFTIDSDKLSTTIENVNGTLIFEDSSVNLTKTSFSHNGIIYMLEGALTELDIDEPECAISLSSENLSADCKFIIKKDYIKIDRISGNIGSSSIKILGDIRDISTSPSANLYCEARFDLADLKRFAPTSEFLHGSFKPSGQCIIAAFYNGSLERISEAEANLKISSAEIMLGDIKLHDLYIDLKMKEGLIKSHRFTLRPYTGLFNGTLDINMNDPERPFSAGFALKDADLKRLSDDIKLKDREFSGLLSSKFSVKGSLGNANSLRGNGWMTITNGWLWELPLLSGVTQILRMPGLKQIVFKEAAGNFSIAESKISTDDLTFYSENVNIRGHGYLDFGGNINFQLDTDIKQDLAEGGSDMAKITNILISQAGSYLGRVKIEGTLKDPKFKLVIKPVKEIFNKKIRGLLKSIFE